jgi:hypothetical protein
MEVTERRRRAAVMAVTESIRQGPNRSFCDSDHQLRLARQWSALSSQVNQSSRRTNSAAFPQQERPAVLSPEMVKGAPIRELGYKGRAIIGGFLKSLHSRPSSSLSGPFSFIFFK